MLEIAGTILIALPAAAELMDLKAELKAASEVPPSKSAATGSGAVTYDSTSKTLTWTVMSTGFTGSATAAHFNGPAEIGKNADVVVPIPGSTSPMKGQATLSDAQAADLMAGKWYINAETSKNEDGEIRRQIV